MQTNADDRYLALLLKRIEVCKKYQPRFGRGSQGGLSLHQFRALYSADPFYSWFGLDTPLVYAAHKAAGGITSVYRQIGTGCEELFRQILQDQLGLDSKQASWSYAIKAANGKARRLKLDGRIPINEVASQTNRDLISQWMNEACHQIGISATVAEALTGAVFEVRQGYKSKDSKRQNADIANASSAYVNGYLPVLVVFSTQIDGDVALRYEHERWLVLRGTLNGSTTQSAYTFVRDVIGYDLESFFQRNAHTIRVAIDEILNVLLSSHD